MINAQELNYETPHTVYGGYGGYSVGNVNLIKNELLYVNIGGKGESVTSNCRLEECLPYNPFGGYNGGGIGGASKTEDRVNSSGGGGATHIATKSGLLSTLENDIDKILIVSGAGGGGGWQSRVVGSGGGASGSSSGRTTVLYSGGTQNSGYSFGLGQPGSNGIGGSSNVEGTAGGGGGFYGGTTGIINENDYLELGLTALTSSGAGGSGFIGNLLSNSRHMTMYASDEQYISTADNTKTQITACHSGDATADCAKEGHGYAKVTLVAINQYSITNLIKNGSFENGLDNWDSWGVDLVESGFNDSTSLRMTYNLGEDTGDAEAMIKQDLPFLAPTIDHIYYSSTMFKSTADYNVLDSRFELINYEAEKFDNYKLSFGTKRIKSEEWIKLSGVKQHTNADFNDKKWMYRSFIRQGTDYSYVDDIIVIDLTESFGAGNEPSKEWCDQNINWFEGTTTIFKR